MSTQQKRARNVRVQTLKKSNREYFAVVGNDELNLLFWGIFSGLWEQINKSGGGEDLEMPTPMEDVWRGEKIICAHIPEIFAYRLIEMKREGGWQSFVIYRQTRGEILKEWKPPIKVASKQKSSLTLTITRLLADGTLRRASDIQKI